MSRFDTACRGHVQTMTSHALETYLSDHHAGSVAGVDFARRVMPDLAVEIEADQAVLEGLMTELGVRTHHWKGFGGWFAAKVVRHTGPHDLVALETLALGIAGKLMLWKALEPAQESNPYLGALDLNRLIDRATAQFDEVEREHMRRAAQLFGAPVTVHFG
jgi:hypothetical protein